MFVFTYDMDDVITISVITVIIICAVAIGILYLLQRATYKLQKLLHKSDDDKDEDSENEESEEEDDNDI